MTELGDRFFFVMGVPKSGTTWLQLLLDAHPRIACRGEDQFDFFLGQVPRLLSEYNQLLKEVDGRTARQGARLFEDRDASEVFRDIVARILAKGFADPRVTLVGTKDNGIVKHLPVYGTFFPKARFVFILRDPRDLAVSRWYHNLRTAEGFAERSGTIAAWSHSVASHWLSDVSKVLALAGRLEGRFHMLRYEDLHAAPEATLAQLLGFLGHAPSEADAALCLRGLPLRRPCQADDLGHAPSEADAALCLRACRFETLSGGRRSGEEDRGSFFRKGTPGDWINHLDDAALSAFRSQSAPLMAQFGYV